MASLENSLLPGERLVARAGLSPLPLVVDWAVVALGAALCVTGVVLLATVPVGIGLLIVGGVVGLFGFGRLVRTLVRRRTTELAVTNRRLVVRAGLLTKESEEMLLTKVESVEVDQRLWERLADVGTVHVHGSGDGRLEFVGIARPHEFRKACLGAVAGREGGDGSVGPGTGDSGPATVFEVRISEPGGERWIEVRGATAVEAQERARQAGVKVIEARLKRIG